MPLDCSVGGLVIRNAEAPGLALANVLSLMSLRQLQMPLPQDELLTEA